MQNKPSGIEDKRPFSINPLFFVSLFGGIISALFISIHFFSFPFIFELPIQVDILNYCHFKNHYALMKCPNGDYLGGQVEIYDDNGTLLKETITSARFPLKLFGEISRYTISGWGEVVFSGRNIGCSPQEAKIICDAEGIVNPNLIDRP